MLDKKIEVTQDCILKIEAGKAGLPLADAQNIIKHFERFLIIAIGRSLDPIDIKVKFGDKQRDYVTFVPYDFKRKTHRDIHVSNMNFSFNDIKNESQEIFSKWFTDKDKYIDVFNLFSVLRSDIPKILENEFKDIVGAIEGYVRIEQNNFSIALARAMKIVNEAIPENDRLLTGNDYERIRATRNKLSHMTSKPADLPLILNHKEMWTITEKLIILFEYSVLKNLGLSQEMLKRFYDNRKIW